MGSTWVAKIDLGLNVMAALNTKFSSLIAAAALSLLVLAARLPVAGAPLPHYRRDCTLPIAADALGLAWRADDRSDAASFV
eukprot:SAG22_NODE_5988_length_920_cov_1.451888_1_plen_80_part_01